MTNFSVGQADLVAKVANFLIGALIEHTRVNCNGRQRHHGVMVSTAQKMSLLVTKHNLSTVFNFSIVKIMENISTNEPKSKF